MPSVYTGRRLRARGLVPDLRGKRRVDFARKLTGSGLTGRKLPAFFSDRWQTS